MNNSNSPTIPSPAVGTDFKIETPQERQERFIRIMCRVILALAGLLAILGLALSIFDSWQTWGLSTIGSVLATAVAALSWWLAAGANKARWAAWFNLSALNLLVIWLYWQSPYFAYYFIMLFLLILVRMMLGRLETLLFYVLLVANTLLYSIAHNNDFYAPDGQRVKLDYGSFAIWWLIIGAIIGSVSYLYNTVQRDNLILNRQAAELKQALQELELRQAERLKAEEALRRSQTQLLQAQKMESIGRLAGGVAHDFNNLLMIILGNTELLLLELPEDSVVRNNLDEIREASERAAALTRQLLAFSRQQVLQPRLLDLNTVVAEMYRLLKRLLREDIELNILPAPTIYPVMADRGQLEQVIMNLAVNARDAMPEGGHLTIETGNIQLDEAFIAAKADLKLKPGDYVMLAISDTGFGMDATVQAHIFEPFFTTKEVGFGTGLGLATTQGIVEQSGGYIQVYSAPRAGTTFKIYLPRADEIAEKSAFQAEASGLETLKGNETILVVEDEEAVRTLIRRVLAQSGYAVLTVAHGKEALALFEAKESSTPIDLVLTDLVMPQMGGVELVEKLKQSQPNLKVIGMSGYTDGVVARKNIFRLVDTYLQKPFTPSGLLNKVREVLDTQEQELR